MSASALRSNKTGVRASALLLVGSGVFDLATAPVAASRYNRDRGLTVSAGSVAGAPGLVASVGFD